MSSYNFCSTPYNILEEQSVVTFDDLAWIDEPLLVLILTFVNRVLLIFLLGHNSQNQYHLAKDFDIIAKHTFLNLGATEVLKEIFPSNGVVARSVTEEQLRYFMTLLVSDKNSNYLDILSTVCSGEGRNKIQMFIIQNLVEESNGEAKRRFLFDTRLEDGAIEIKTANKANWTPLKDVMAALPDKASATSVRKYAVEQLNFRSIPSKNRRFFISTLKLYQALCENHNRFAINKISNEWKLKTKEECLIGLYDENLPSSIRALYGNLLRVMFIDYYPVSPLRTDFVLTLASIKSPPTIEKVMKDSNIIERDNRDENNISKIQRSRSFNILSAEVPAPEEVETQEYDALHKWISQFLTSIRYVDQESDQLARSVVDLLRCLIRFGKIRNLEKIFTLVNKASAVLLSSFFSEGLKLVICEVIELFLCYERELRVYWYTYYWFRNCQK